jgi:hypothetical protein
MFSKSPISAGMGPFKLLRSKPSLVKLAISPISVGTVPVNRLRPVLRISRVVTWPISVGIGPWSSLRSTWRRSTRETRQFSKQEDSQYRFRGYSYPSVAMIFGVSKYVLNRNKLPISEGRVPVTLLETKFKNTERGIGKAVSLTRAKQMTSCLLQLCLSLTQGIREEAKLCGDSSVQVLIFQLQVLIVPESIANEIVTSGKPFAFIDLVV